VATTSFPDASPRKENQTHHTARGGAPLGAAPGGSCTAQVSPGDLLVIAADPAFARQFGLGADEIRGHGLFDLLSSAGPAPLRERFAALRSGRSRHFTESVTGRDRDGRTFTAELTGTATRRPSGEITRVVVLLRRTGEARRPEKATAPGGAPVLSALDAQVLEGVASGESTVQLASRLYLSRQGIEYRVGQMLRRFDAPNRPALVARAHALGMFATGQWPPRVLPERVK
jgi:PAS domain S-box-containing protein